VSHQYTIVLTIFLEPLPVLQPVVDEDCDQDEHRDQIYGPYTEMREHEYNITSALICCLTQTAPLKCHYTIGWNMKICSGILYSEKIFKVHVQIFVFFTIECQHMKI